MSARAGGERCCCLSGGELARDRARYRQTGARMTHRWQQRGRGSERACGCRMLRDRAWIVPFPQGGRLMPGPALVSGGARRLRDEQADPVAGAERGVRAGRAELPVAQDRDWRRARGPGDVAERAPGGG